MLADIRQIFTQSNAARLSSKQLVASLCALPIRPGANPLIHQSTNPSVRSLARLLRPFGINSHNIRLGDQQTKGYDLADFTESFTRFLDDSPQSQRD